MKVFFDIVGCRLNQSEAENLANSFRALGHQIVGDAAQADIAIINTCAVTTKAAADSRKKLRRASRLGAKQVIATGCWATLYPKRALKLEGVTKVYPNLKKDEIVADILHISPDLISSEDLIRVPLPGERARTRAFIKVQEGCNHHCTYCLTRVARGKSQSRSINEIRRDIHSAVVGGAKEIVLTGVQLGSWGRDFDKSLRLKDLLINVLNLDGFDRLRLSSIEPWDFDENMINLWQDNRLCRHLHIPLQSGDDRILKAMARPITNDSYRALIENIRSSIPNIAITTDVIVGFPGETEDAFSNTKLLIQSLAFAGGHVFTFSPRPGTVANEMPNQIDSFIAKARNAELRKMFTKSGFDFRDHFIDEQLPVLWESATRESKDIWQLSGLTDNYIRVFSTAKANLWNTITPVLLEDHHPKGKGLMGVIR